MVKEVMNCVVLFQMFAQGLCLGAATDPMPYAVYAEGPIILLFDGRGGVPLDVSAPFLRCTGARPPIVETPPDGSLYVGCEHSIKDYPPPPTRCPVDTTLTVEERPYPEGWQVHAFCRPKDKPVA